ncbi:MAG: hypothetical protein WKF31_01300 [Thermoleophilaceae bacterium]
MSAPAASGTRAAGRRLTRPATTHAGRAIIAQAAAASSGTPPTCGPSFSE